MTSARGDLAVHLALVGHGYWGPNLLRNYIELESAWVEWVCDARSEALERCRRRYPSLPVTTNVADVLGDSRVEAIVLATPISSHYRLARAALEAGKHVFIEKPMAVSVEECRRLIDLAASRRRTLMVGHTFVFSPPVRKVKEIIDSGDVGEVRFITSSRVNLGLHQQDVSVLWDLAAHDFSILFYWLEEEAEHISVTGRCCVGPGAPDVAFINLRFPSGIVANVNVSWLSPVKLRRTMVVGSKKMLLYDDTESVEKVKVFDHGVDLERPRDFGEFQLSYRTGDIVAPKLEPTEPLFAEAAHFVDCIRRGTRPVTDGESGLQVVSMLEAAEASLRSAVADPSVPA